MGKPNNKPDLAEAKATSTSLLEGAAFPQALRRAIVGPVVALVIATALLLGLLIYLFSTAGQADHSNAVLARISRVEKLAVDMESGVRGYLITADPVFLEPFYAASPVFNGELDTLAQLVKDNPHQQNEAEALRRSHAAWTDFATNVRERVQSRLPLDIAGHLRGKELMDTVRGHINEMQQHERRLLTERAAAREQLRWITMVAVVLFTLLLAPFIAISARRAMQRLSRNYRTALTAVDEERERLGVTLSSIGDAVIATDADGRITYMNPVARAITGWGEEAIGRPLEDVFRIINEQSRQAVPTPVEMVLRENRILALANHTLLIAKDGRETSIADSAAPIHDANGKIAGVVLVFRDQTPEREAARKVEWLASFPERNPNPVLELDMEAGAVIYANSFVDRAFPDLKAKGMQHELFHRLREAARPLLEGHTEFVRREISVGESCYVQTISLPEMGRLRVYCSDITVTKAIEGALRLSEERFRKVFEHAASGVAIADVQGRLQECNPAFCSLVGFAEAELRGRLATELVHPEDLAEFSQAIQELQNGKLPFYEIEGRYVHKDGRPVWVRKFVSVLLDSNGNPTNLVVLVTDIQERKRAERLLNSQKKSLEMVVTGSPLCEVLAFLAQVVEELSEGKATASILLLDSEGLLRNGASPTLPADYLKAIDGLKPCAGVGTCCAAAATGQVVITPDIDADEKWRTLKHLPLNLGYVAAWSQPITATDGSVLGTFGTYFRECREPTAFERQAVEILSRNAALAIERRRVEDDRKRFVSLAENSSDFIGICDAEYRLVFVNRAGLAMVGLDDFERACRIPVQEFFFPEDQERIMQRYFPSVLTTGHGQLEVRFRHFKTSEALWMLYNVWVLTDDQGKFAGLATLSRNITDRKRAEDALRESEARYRSLFESIDE